MRLHMLLVALILNPHLVLAAGCTGDKIAYVHNVTENRYDYQEIMLMGSNGQNPKQTTADHGSTPPYISRSDPAWSPDGKFIAYCYQVGKSNCAIYKMDQSGNSIHVYDDGTSYDDSSPTWSPDGQKIAFVRAIGTKKPSQIGIIDPSKPVNSTNPTFLDTGYLNFRSLNWSPDGAWLLFGCYEQNAPSSYLSRHLCVMKVSGGPPVDLTLQQGAQQKWGEITANWSKDGNELIVGRTLGTSGELWIYRIGFNPQPKVTYEKRLAAGGSNDFAVVKFDKASDVLTDGIFRYFRSGANKTLLQDGFDPTQQCANEP